MLDNDSSLLCVARSQGAATRHLDPEVARLATGRISEDVAHVFVVPYPVSSIPHRDLDVPQRHHDTVPTPTSPQGMRCRADDGLFPA